MGLKAKWETLEGMVARKMMKRKGEKRGLGESRN